MEVQDFVLIPEAIPKPVFMFNGHGILSGKKMSPLKGIVYGDNGVGKTTLLASAKNPIIMDMEGNCSHIDAPNCRITTLHDFGGFIDALLAQNHDYKSLIVDSLDSLEVLISTEISDRYTQTELDFGKGAAIWKTYAKDIIDKLDKLNTRKGMNILFTAHWKAKSANNPMTEQYDRYDLRINEIMRTNFCNWSQFIVLAIKDVIFEEKKKGDFGKKKAKSLERRVLYTRGDPTYYGKNVFNLPEKMPMDWEQFTNNVKNFYSK